MKNIKQITNSDIEQKEKEKEITIATNYAEIYATLERLKKELESTKDDDIRRGLVMAQMALLNKKKARFEKTYFNY